MTDPINSARLRAELDDNARLLSNAREDAALYARLKGAAREADRLTKREAELTSLLSQALEAEADARRAAIFAQFKDIRVGVYLPDGVTNVLKARWTITFERLTYDSQLRQSIMKEHTVEDFDRLSPEALLCLTEAKPERIPSLITDLAPGNPAAALEVYFRAKSRGYLVA